MSVVSWLAEATVIREIGKRAQLAGYFKREGLNGGQAVDAVYAETDRVSTGLGEGVGDVRRRKRYDPS